MTGWTYGAEHELADLDRRAQLPAGFKWDDRDCTIVNSNGVANCPKGQYYRFGGEINTPPTDSIAGQVQILTDLKALFPEAKVNYRSNTHAHIRVPGLRDDLRALKRIAMYNRYWLPKVLPVIEPIPKPTTAQYARAGDLRGALRRYKRRKRSHHTVLTEARTARMLTAHTLDEFFRYEVPEDKQGRPMWHAQARAAVNLRQLRETDTIEFRHFPGTLDEGELRHCFEWCENYLLCALCPTWGLRPATLDPLGEFAKSHRDMLCWAGFPTFPFYDHTLEIRYRMTCHDGSVPKEQIVNSINKILEGRVNDFEWEKALKW